MCYRSIIGVVFAFSLLTIASLVWSARRNIAPDAVTRATTYNIPEGDPRGLIDGFYPGHGTDPKAVHWLGKGIVTLEWERVLPVAMIRVFSGETAGIYTVRVYRGGHLIDEGTTRDPEGELVTQVLVNETMPNGWTEINMPSNTTGDNIEFWIIGGADLYEIEIVVDDPQVTAVERTTWGKVKVRIAH